MLWESYFGVAEPPIEGESGIAFENKGQQLRIAPGGFLFHMLTELQRQTLSSELRMYDEAMQLRRIRWKRPADQIAEFGDTEHEPDSGPHSQHSTGIAEQGRANRGAAWIC